MALLSGWLFADLLLVLFLVALVSVPMTSSAKRPTVSAGASASAAASAGPSPSASQSHPQGLDPSYVTLEVHVSPDEVRSGDGGKAAFRSALDSQLAKKNPKGYPVGFVLVFAAGPDTPDGQAQAIDTANKVVADLGVHDRAFSSSVGLGYWGAPDGTFDLKIFFLYA